MLVPKQISLFSFDVRIQTSIQRPKPVPSLEIKHVKMSVPRARLLDLMKVKIPQISIACPLPTNSF